MKPFTMLAVIVFTFVAIAQLARAIFAWEVVIAGFVIPVWLSFILGPIAALLAVMVWRENHARHA